MWSLKISPVYQSHSHQLAFVSSDSPGFNPRVCEPPCRGPVHGFSMLLYPFRTDLSHDMMAAKPCNKSKYCAKPFSKVEDPGKDAKMA